MPSRRQFLKEVTGGLVFVGCGLTDVAARSAQVMNAGRHAPVTLRGRRILTVDIHAHCIVPKAADLLKRSVNLDSSQRLDGQAFADRIKSMDAQGIDMAVLSINPNWYDID